MAEEVALAGCPVGGEERVSAFLSAERSVFVVLSLCLSDCSEVVMVVGSFAEFLSFLSLQELSELRVSSSLSSSELEMVVAEIAERWREVCLSVSSVSSWRS